MPAWTLTGKDTLIINGVSIQGLGSGTTVNIEIPDTLVEVNVWKNGNASFANKKQGQKVRMTIAAQIRGDIHQAYIQTVNQWIQNPASTILWTGSFVKNLGDGVTGAIGHVSYVLNGGIPEKLPPLMENVDGDGKQAIPDLIIMWASAIPVID